MKNTICNFTFVLLTATIIYSCSSGSEIDSDQTETDSLKVEEPIRRETRQKQCLHCEGLGYTMEHCSHCVYNVDCDVEDHGGYVKVQSENVVRYNDGSLFGRYETEVSEHCEVCNRCNSTGLIKTTCPACRGQGVFVETVESD